MQKHKPFRSLHVLTEAHREQFWSCVAVGKKRECWPFRGVNAKGYGQFYPKGRRKDGPYQAHRVAYYFSKQIDPKMLEACHTCDNPPCCNPSHLFLGTRKDNMEDCAAKDRNMHGDRHYGSRVTSTTVRKIRREHKSGVSAKVLAKRYKLGNNTVHCMLSHKTWVRAGGYKQKLFLGYGEKHSKAKLTEKQVRSIRLQPCSVSHAALGRKYGVTLQNIRHIRLGLSWRHVK